MKRSINKYPVLTTFTFLALVAFALTSVVLISIMLSRMDHKVNGLSDDIAAIHALVEHEASVPVRSSVSLPPDDFNLPAGASYCGSCSGCGEHHILWGDDYHDHDDDCDHDH